MKTLPGLYSGAIAKVFPSIHEGFGLAPLEAMACGIPVIVSKAGAVSEVVEEAGIVLEKSDPENIAEAMKNIFQDQKLREELGAKGRARANEFSWEKTAQQTMDVYRKVVNKHG